jgi:hypothetical protein
MVIQVIGRLPMTVIGRSMFVQVVEKDGKKIKTRVGTTEKIKSTEPKKDMPTR